MIFTHDQLIGDIYIQLGWRSPIDFMLDLRNLTSKDLTEMCQALLQGDPDWTKVQTRSRKLGRVFSSQEKRNFIISLASQLRINMKKNPPGTLTLKQRKWLVRYYESCL